LTFELELDGGAAEVVIDLTHLSLIGGDGFFFEKGGPEMADRKRDANHKAIQKTVKQMCLLRQGGGLLVLILGLLLPATLFTSISSDAVEAPEETLNVSTSVASSAQEVSTEDVQEPAEMRMIKIQMILEKFKTGLPLKSKLRLAQLIYHESLQYNYDPELVLALIITESSFNNWSKSRMGALGLMQILPTTGRDVAKAKNIHWRGKRTLFDPHLNIKLGIHYLAELHDRFGDLEIAITAYNFGPSRVAEMQKNCDPLPRGYTDRVMNTYKRFLEWDVDELATLFESASWKAVRI
jgi:soluble lytic murein transglycosylase